MSIRISARRPVCASLLALMLNGCFHPPYNNFQDDRRTLKAVAISAGIGAGAGAAVGSVTGNIAAGAIVGGAAGVAVGLYQNSLPTLLRQLRKEDIEVISYGDTMTVLVPIDGYFHFNSPKLNDIAYPGLNDIVRLIKYHPNTPVYVAAFTDNIGSRHHKKMLSQAQAETMLTFLWANNIPAQHLRAEGYEDKHDIGDNHLIRGSAYNRRIEIQWLTVTPPQSLPAPYVSAMR